MIHKPTKTIMCNFKVTVYRMDGSRETTRFMEGRWAKTFYMALAPGGHDPEAGNTLKIEMYKKVRGLWKLIIKG